ncbi:FAD/NAD(P)-binding domain-containing protein [Corynespora cassiicola Philippines]|uniref:FAD/NAD(P)-binding domain-containing protein n=1 Tax=Corynespora cassiicola Philippines TaxID=1448308 RepID=A0A2T2P5P0_CORCC|nr:FAD/NAD(P)-binding domain-containing protein [Corynespora cassiicola Philippines]
MYPQEPFVIVVGAGPSGLLLSLLLARAKIPVTLVEKASKLDSQPRATHYAAPAASVLRRAGVVDEVAARGFFPNKLTFRTLQNEVLGVVDHTIISEDEERLICLPLNELGEILLARLQNEPFATILWDHEVMANIKDDNGVGFIVVKTPEGEKELRARYIVGCDGANSQIRRGLFGDWEFPGKTWDVQIVATNAYYDFEKFGYQNANFIIDPEHWHMASKITQDGMWRVSYGVSASLTKEEILEQRAEKWQKMLPGNPLPESYKITNFSPYKVHQRLAKSMRVGPFILAADAAHLCNPFGGLGLTGGIVDIGGLFDCLYGLYHGKADDTILDVYSKIRSEKYKQLIDPVSSSTLLVMQDGDPGTVAQRDPFLKAINSVDSDSKMREIIGGIKAIEYDFTQHYTV